MHTSTRTKYSNERFTTPPFKCHTQFMAAAEWASSLTAVELNLHQSGELPV